PEYRLDVSHDQLRASTPQEYAEDLTSHPRALVLGDTWQTGTPINGIAQRFAIAGSRLVPVDDHDQVTTAFDTATGRALRFRLPPTYHPQPTASFHLFEWLDDDTVALAVEGATGDILTCQLSNGRCVVAVRAPKSGDPGEAHRILPNFPLPG
nr:hypothetical protein [Propionibacteriales bacterium]